MTCALYRGSRSPGLGWGSCWGSRADAPPTCRFHQRAWHLGTDLGEGMGVARSEAACCTRVVTSWANKNRTRGRRLASCANSHFGGLMAVSPNAAPRFSQDLERLVGLADRRAGRQGRGPQLVSEPVSELSASSQILGRGEGVGPPLSEAWLSHLQKYLMLAQSDPRFGMEPGMRPGLGPGPSFSFRPRLLGTPELQDAPTRSGRAPASSAPGPRPRGPPGQG